MPKNKYVYFVSYTFQYRDGRWGFGCISLDIDQRINSWEHTLLLKKTIEEYKTNENVQGVVVNNYKLLKVVYASVWEAFKGLVRNVFLPDAG